MNTVRRTPIKENESFAPEARNERANKSAVQWLFNPFSIADTTNWATATGVGKLNVGGLTKVKNHTVKATPNKTRKVDQSTNEVDFDSTSNFSGHYAENERLAFYIATEITGAFPRRIHRIAGMEGIEETEVAEQIQNLLLGEEMAISEIEGEIDPVPNLKQMLEVLRYNMGRIAKSNSPQKALLLKVGKEFESALADNIKLAVEDLKIPQQEVAKGKRAGFDVNSKRNFLALGMKVPNLKFENQDSPETGAKESRLSKSLDRLSDLLEAGQNQTEPAADDFVLEDDRFPNEVAEEDEEVELPEGFLNDVDANAIIATTQGSETEMSFVEPPPIVETKPLTAEQLEKAASEDAKKADAAQKKKAEAAEAAEANESTTPRRCKATKGDGERCKNDALDGSEYCYLEAHQAQGKK